MLMAFTGPILLTNMSVWITVGLTEDSSGEKQEEGTISSVQSQFNEVYLGNNNDKV